VVVAAAATVTVGNKAAKVKEATGPSARPINLVQVQDLVQDLLTPNVKALSALLVKNAYK
jgi:hypothetical protein